MILKLEHVSHEYVSAVRSHTGIVDVSLDLSGHHFSALVGHTGSGKSTLMQHLNALLQPTSGTVTIGDNAVTSAKNKQLYPIRQRVGLVFQNPEYQLFEETVAKDIMYGPMNYGATAEEAMARAKEALMMVGLSEEFLERYPLEMSGGQMRRVAIAGILAMNPDVLVLDEPTVGLDPLGQTEMMELFKHLFDEYQKTIIIATHNMDVVAEYAQRVVVLEGGELVYDGKPHELFIDEQLAQSLHLEIPHLYKVVLDLQRKGRLAADFGAPFSAERLAEALKEK